MRRAIRFCRRLLPPGRRALPEHFAGAFSQHLFEGGARLAVHEVIENLLAVGAFGDVRIDGHGPFRRQFLVKKLLQHRQLRAAPNMN